MHREPRMFWENTRQPVERGSECRATHTYTLATALTPLPSRRGLPRESPLVHMYPFGTRAYVPWYVHVNLQMYKYNIISKTTRNTSTEVLQYVPGTRVRTTTHSTIWYVRTIMLCHNFLYHGTHCSYHGTSGTMVRTCVRTRVPYHMYVMSQLSSCNF
jgi:hypothetical protein